MEGRQYLDSAGFSPSTKSDVADQGQHDGEPDGGGVTDQGQMGMRDQEHTPTVRPMSEKKNGNWRGGGEGERKETLGHSCQRRQKCSGWCR